MRKGKKKIDQKIKGTGLKTVKIGVLIKIGRQLQMWPQHYDLNSLL